MPPIEVPPQLRCPCCGAGGTLRLHAAYLKADGAVASIATCGVCLVQVHVDVAYAQQRGALDNDANQADAHATYYAIAATPPAALAAQVAAGGFLTEFLAGQGETLDRLTYLELGYGSGFSLYAAAQRVHHAMGVDLVDTGIRHLCKVLGTPANLELAPDMQALSRQADVAVLWHVLEHIPDCPTFLQQLRARLAPRGRVLLQVPLLRRGVVFDAHISFFGIASLRHLFAQAGFVEVNYWFDLENEFLTYLARLPC